MYIIIYTLVLPCILDSYEVMHIFNADEAGLFYKLLPNESLMFKNYDLFEEINLKKAIATNTHTYIHIYVCVCVSDDMYKYGC